MEIGIICSGSSELIETIGFRSTNSHLIAVFKPFLSIRAQSMRLKRWRRQPSTGVQQPMGGQDGTGGVGSAKAQAGRDLRLG